jgi:hypothetical protein
MTYVFRGVVPMCRGCDHCYRLYWYFECRGDDCVLIGDWDPREKKEPPDWLDEVQLREEDYDYWNYSSPDTTWGTCYDVTKTPRENAEAEEIALWLSGSLVAPEDLYSVIDGHLAVIREEYGEQTPELKRISFSPYLFSDEVLIDLMPEAMERYRAGTYGDLDSLNTLYGVKTTKDLGGNWLHLILEGRYHPLRLAEIYWQVPSVLTAAPTGIALICVPSTVIPQRQE